MYFVATVFIVAATLGAPPDPQTITGGQFTTECQWSSTVAMLDEFGTVFCTGTLIDPEVVLFAAHCQEAVTPVSVAFGEDGHAPARVVPVSQCVMHPSYSVDGVADLAYCTLSAPVTDVPIVPPLMGCELEEITVGKTVTIVGYGSTHARWDAQEGGWVDTMGTGPKRAATQTVEELYDQWSLILAGVNMGGCAGDSGGPAMLQLADGSWRVLGAAASIHPNSPDGPNACGFGTVYTMIEPEMGWLETGTGIDVTPCHDADGTWNPDERCTGFPMTPEAGVGSWAGSCGNAQPSGPSATCGPPIDVEPGETDSASGTDSANGTDTAGFTDGTDATDGADAGTGGNDDDEANDDDNGEESGGETTSPSGIDPGPPIPRGDGGAGGCGCSSDGRHRFWTTMLLAVVAFGWRRRRPVDPKSAQR